MRVALIMMALLSIPLPVHADEPGYVQRIVRGHDFGGAAPDVPPARLNVSVPSA